MRMGGPTAPLAVPKGDTPPADAIVSWAKAILEVDPGALATVNFSYAALA